MSAFTLTDALIIINGVTLSDHINQVKVEDNREAKDFTTFGATSKIVGKGLGDGKITMKIFQDFASGKTHATLQPLIGSTTGIVVEVRATSAARSATNPAVLMTALMFDYNMIDGSVGEPSTINVEFQNASSAGITYPTA